MKKVKTLIATLVIGFVLCSTALADTESYFKYEADKVCNLKNSKNEMLYWEVLNYNNYQECMDKQIKAQFKIFEYRKKYWKKDAIITKEEVIIMDCTDSSKVSRLTNNYEQMLYCLEQNL